MWNVLSESLANLARYHRFEIYTWLHPSHLSNTSLCFKTNKQLYHTYSHIAISIKLYFNGNFISWRIDFLAKEKPTWFMNEANEAFILFFYTLEIL